MHCNLHLFSSSTCRFLFIFASCCSWCWFPFTFCMTPFWLDWNTIKLIIFSLIDILFYLLLTYSIVIIVHSIICWTLNTFKQASSLIDNFTNSGNIGFLSWFSIWSGFILFVFLTVSAGSIGDLTTRFGCIIWIFSLNDQIFLRFLVNLRQFDCICNLTLESYFCHVLQIWNLNLLIFFLFSLCFNLIFMFRWYRWFNNHWSLKQRWRLL